MSGAERRPPERRRAGSDRRRPARDAELLGTVDPRLGIRKTWKMYLGGVFIRSESGRYLVTGDKDATVPRGSRKDVRDAVRAAESALPVWTSLSACNRGQILYRLAEVMEGRRAELEATLARAGAPDPAREAAAAIDRVTSYAGWSDKYQSLLASYNPVIGPHFGFSVPEPVGVVGVVAPERPSLHGLISALCPIVVSGNVTVVVAAEGDPRPALVVAECLHTSDVPAGVVNVLSGLKKELAPTLGSHKAIRALDLWDIDAELAAALERAAADSIKRVTRRSVAEARFYDDEWAIAPQMIERFVEYKSVWHPVGC